MMRCRARFDADQTRLERLEVGDYFAAPQPPANDNMPVCVDTVDLEPVLGEIQTDRGNLHVDGSSRCGVHRRPRCGASMPGAGPSTPSRLSDSPEGVTLSEVSR